MEKTRVELKTYFETGKKPTQQEYADLIDSFLHRLDDTNDFIAALPDATTTQKGIAEQATLAEVDLGTDSTRFVTPAGAKRATQTHAVVKSVNGQTGDVVINLGTNNDSGWTNAGLQNGILNYSPGYQVARYRKKDDVVYIEGVVKGGSGGPAVTVFTLPIGFIPGKRIIFPAMTAAGSSIRLEIQDNGNVVCYGFNTTWTSLSVSFLVG